MNTRALLLALPLLAAAACSKPNRSSVEPQTICAMTDNCTFTATCTNTLMGNTWIDADVTNYIEIALQVANQLPNNKDVTLGRANTNDAHVDGYVLEYEGGNLGSITVATNQTVPAAGTTVMLIELVPYYLNAQTALQTYVGAAAGSRVTKLLPVNLKLRGYYDDGTRFETGDFPIALYVCRGCLAGCPVGTTAKCPPGNPGQSPVSCG